MDVEGHGTSTRLLLLFTVHTAPKSFLCCFSVKVTFSLTDIMLDLKSL